MTVSTGKQFEGKVAFITGGGTGIGLATAQALARERANVALVGQLFVVNAGNLDVDIDTIYQRAADLLLVTGDGHSRKTAFFRGVPVKSAGAGVRVAVVVPTTPIYSDFGAFFISIDGAVC